MTGHQLKLMELKLDFLNIITSTVDEENYIDEYGEKLKNCFIQHLDIEKCCFLLFENEILKPYIHVNSMLKISEMDWTKFEDTFREQIKAPIPAFLKAQEEFKEYTDIVLLKDNVKVYGVFLCKSSSLWNAFCQSNVFTDFVTLLTKVINSIVKNIEIRINEKQYKQLYNMTDLFHSTMEIDVILENVISTMKEYYQEFDVELILSNDQERKTTLNIKQFDYLSERSATVEAFVSGNITIERVKDLNCCLLNSPIKGRQAIYGILQVKAPYDYNFTKREKEFIRMLTNTSGNALENAKLYHQSHRLISDLQLINETSHRLNSEINITEMLIFLRKQLMKSFQPKELCFVIKENDQFRIAEGSSEFFESEEGLLYINHVAKHFDCSKDPLFIADFSRLISNDVNYKSMMAIPMFVEQQIIGFSIVLHTDSYFFSFDSFKLMQSLIQHSSLAISNSFLRSKLQEMIDYDHLTNLYARSYLDEFVVKSLASDDSGMFLLLDIDDFKRVNDSFGHQVGDQVLVQIGEKLIQEVGDIGVCARWGGEELSVYVPNVSKEEAFQLSETIVSQIPKVTNPVVTVSAGLITWDKSDRPEFQKLFLQADTALYHAKNSGKNKFCYYEDIKAFYS